MKTGSDATNSKEGGSDVIGLKGEGDKVVDKCDSLLETRSNEIVNSTKSVTNSGDNGEAVQVNTDLTEIEKCKERNEVKEATLGSDSDVEDHEDTGKDIVNNR